MRLFADYCTPRPRAATDALHITRDTSGRNGAAEHGEVSKPAPPWCVRSMEGYVTSVTNWKPGDRVERTGLAHRRQGHAIQRRELPLPTQHTRQALRFVDARWAVPADARPRTSGKYTLDETCPSHGVHMAYRSRTSASRTNQFSNARVRLAVVACGCPKQRGVDFDCARYSPLNAIGAMQRDVAFEHTPVRRLTEIPELPILKTVQPKRRWPPESNPSSRIVHKRHNA